MIWNYMLCFIFIGLLIAEVIFIVKRNRNIVVQGKDDFFTFSLVLLFVLIIFPLTEQGTIVEYTRNILVLITVLGSTGMKRGFSETGVEKIVYTIKWDEIQEVYINEHQQTKIQVICKTKKGKQKLLFGKYRLKEVLSMLEKHTGNIYMQESLQPVLNMKKCT